MQNSDLERLASSTDDDAHWSWTEQHQNKWQKESGGIQEFYDKWLAHPFEPHKTFPYIMTLGRNEKGMPLLNSPWNTMAGEIVVTEAYDEMFNRILEFREERGSATGVVLTGQPGIGKSTFLKYMLVRLISERQVIVQFNGVVTTLFKAGEVYTHQGSGFAYIPVPREQSVIPVWALIDVDSGETGAPLTEDLLIWPIQVSPPTPVRWRSWSKQFRAAIWGLPLWTLEELVYGFPLQKGYTAFRENLEKAISEATPLTTEPAIRVALGVLGKEEEKGDPDCRAITFRAGEDKPNGDHVIEVLVGNAVDNFGFAPRVTYGAIFFPNETLAEHDQAIANLKYPDLEDLARSFIDGLPLIIGPSHHLVSVMPSKEVELPIRDSWEISFKSIQIAKKMVIKMRQEEDKRLRQMYATFYKSPESSGLAGSVFEALAHRTICRGSCSDEQTSHMYPDRMEPPSFSTAIPSSAIGTPLAPIPSLPGNSTRDTSIDLARSLDDFIPDGKIYYIPRATKKPLFDSFTITFNDSKTTALISVFQMTISRAFRGSTKDYELIRKIMRSVHEFDSSLQISVAYWLVCPTRDPLEERLWKMPDGWADSSIANDHRGHVFCLHIPITHTNDSKE